MDIGLFINNGITIILLILYPPTEMVLCEAQAERINTDHWYKAANAFCVPTSATLKWPTIEQPE